jgi:uncharacterized membrane protein
MYPVACLIAGSISVFSGFQWKTHNIPYEIMEQQIARLHTGAGGYNRANYGVPGKNLKLQIEKANPEIQSVYCAYDLSAGPVRAYGPVWDGYWSLSLYQANSDNYYVLTNSETDGAFDVTILPPGSEAASKDEVVSPSSKGILLIRMFLGSADAIPAAREAAAQTACEVIHAPD